MLDLKSRASNFPSEPSHNADEEPSAAETIASMLALARRQLWIVLVLALLGSVLGAVYFVNAPQKYTATATLLINTRKIEILQQPTVSDTMSMQAIGAVESQVELLRSDEVALRVIKKLDLIDDTRFIDKNSHSLFGRLLRRLTGRNPTTLSDDEGQSMALKLFDEGLSVDRVGVTYAIQIKFQSKYPDIAAEIANAVAEAYIDLQRSTENDAAQRTSEWLEVRIPELRAKSEAAQKAVVEYKNDHNIVETGAGVLIEDQGLTDLNLKRNTAHDETLKAKARFDQFVTLDVAGVPNATLAGPNGASGAELLEKLRGQYFEVTSKEAQSSVGLGPNNPVIVSLRNQKAQLRGEIAEEIQRLKTSSQSDYQAAQDREAAIGKEFDAAVAQTRGAKEAQIKLRELEASAHAYQDLYATYINRYNASLQQAASPIAEASVITSATPLIQRDYKKTIQTAVLFPVAGLMIGLGISLARELLASRVFLTSKSIQSRLGVPCVGLLPDIPHRRRKGWWKKDKQEGASNRRTIARGDRGVGWTVVEQPFSQFTEGVRSIKFALDLDNRSQFSRVIGMTSAMPNEGKSTVALSLAQLIANSGASVVLVDCDLRNPSLTRSLAPDATIGLVEVVRGGGLLDQAIWTDDATGLAFLPTAPRARVADPLSILSSADLRRVFGELRENYQYVVVDLSPMLPVIDVCATVELIDAFVLVVEWGRTTVDVVKRALRAAPGVSELMIGAALNKADIKILTTYDPHATGYYLEDVRN